MLNLKEIRLEKEISLDKLSAMSGIAKSTISELENGKHKASIDSICKLCRALKVTPSDLIKREYWG